MNDFYFTVMIWIFIAFMLCLAYCYAEFSCKTKAEIQEMEWSFGLVQGCMVKQEGKWLDYDRLRYMD